MATRPRQPITAIRNFDELKAAIKASGLPDDYFSHVSMNQLLLDLTNSRFTIAPTFYEQLQDFLAQSEVTTQQPLSGLATQQDVFPAAAAAYDYGSPPVDPNAARLLAEAEAARAAASVRNYPAEQAAQQAWEEQQAQLDRDQQIRLAQDEAIREQQQREWQAEQNRIEAENRLRLQRLGDLTQLVGQFAGIQARARETLAGLQGDPFKFAAAKQGLAPQGVTPGEQFSSELNQFVGQPMPQINPNAGLQDIEAQIQGLSGQMAPQAPRIFGMAGGGSVMGNQPETVLVGEKGPEVVVGSNFQVLPLTGSGAGGYTSESLLPALAPLYAGLGLSSVPKTGTHGIAPGIQGQATSLGGNVGLLGYNPRLIRDAQTGGTYYRDDQGMLQHILSPEDFGKFGFNWKDVLNVNSDQIGAFGAFGGNLTEKPQVPIQTPSAFGPLSTPIIEPVTGAILPAPYRAAALLNQLRLTNPGFYRLALSAYANSMSRAGDPNARLGYTQEDVEAEYQQALPTGAAHGLIGLR